jgi:hypothetical protein
MKQRVVKEETLTAYSLYSQLQLSLVMDKAYLGQGNRMLIEFSNSEELGLKFDGQLRL